MLTDTMLLRIYVAESTLIKEKPAYKFLVEYIKDKGFPGYTVLRGMIGYGHEYKIRTVDADLTVDVPVNKFFLRRTLRVLLVFRVDDPKKFERTLMNFFSSFGSADP